MLLTDIVKTEDMPFFCFVEHDEQNYMAVITLDPMLNKPRLVFLSYLNRLYVAALEDDQLTKEIMGKNTIISSSREPIVV